MPAKAGLNPEMRYKGQPMATIDLRAEDWELRSGDTQTKKIVDSLKSFWDRPPFYGEIPGEVNYLYYDGQNFRQINTPPDRIICLDDLPLKRNWWDYAQGLDPEGNEIKVPCKRREAENFVRSTSGAFVPNDPKAAIRAGPVL